MRAGTSENRLRHDRIIRIPAIVHSEFLRLFVRILLPFSAQTAMLLSQQRRITMINVKRFLLASGMGAALVLGATPSMAQSHYYEPGNNGSVWSNYNGYTDQLRTSRQSGATSRDRAQTRVRRQDDPPGSSYQDLGNRESNGE
jgi:hypothetical protein